MSKDYSLVIVQANNSYPSSSMANTSSSSPSMAPSSTSSSYTQTNSSGSSRSYISATASSRASFPAPLSRNSIKPAQIAGEYAYGQKEFVYTGRPQGGNPNGGPRQHPEGYIRVSKGNVTVHNSGGQLMGSVPVDLGPEYENGPEHSDECRASSRWSDNQGLCFCLTKGN